MVYNARGQQTVGILLQKRCQGPGDRRGDVGRQHSHALGALGAVAQQQCRLQGAVQERVAANAV